MNLEAITIQAKPSERESLALAVRAVARTAAGDPTYDELCAALGVSLVATAGPSDSSPALWLTYARDAFLTQTARLFGMRLRDLHPPDVGMDMLWAEEFTQHFELSYKPLIRRALENGQPVLAWRGWEGDAAALWGVITGWNERDLLGVVPGSAERVRLAGPALQCYVVECYERRTPPPGELLAAVIAHANAYLSQAGVPCRHHGPGTPQIVAGPPAYDLWARWMEAQLPGAGEDPAREAYRAYACALCSGRLSAARFLDRSYAVEGPDHAIALDSIVSACEDLAADVSPFCRSEEIRAFWRTAEGHQELLEAIRSAQAADRQIAAQIRHLASTAPFVPTGQAC